MEKTFRKALLNAGLDPELLDKISSLEDIDMS